MKNLKLFFAFALLAGVLFSSCGEDEPFAELQNANVAFAGRVIDENGASVDGALVSLENGSTITDKNGVFYFKPTVTPATHALISVEKSGYFTMSRPHMVKNNSTQIVTIQLLRKDQAGIFSGASGGLVNVSGGPKLNFPNNAIADENGQIYTGQARVFARYLDPSDPQLGWFAPGNMSAENSAGDVVFLATYGMIAVEIEGMNGEKLNIAPGKMVELSMPVIATQAAAAPATIPLWYYDLEKGYWREEGSAQKQGNEYVGYVSHFSFWNCDAPFPLTYVSGRIILESNNLPLAGAHIKLTLLSTGSISYGFTDMDGYYSGCVPLNESLLMEVKPDYSCTQVAYSQQISPVQGPTTLPDIIIPTSSLDIISVAGKLINCAGQGVNNGYAKISLDAITGVAFTNNNGEFQFFTLNCQNIPLSGEVIGYDQNNYFESQPIAISTPPNQVSLGNIPVCTALTEFISYSLDGQAFTVVDPSGIIFPDSIPLGTYYSRITGWVNNINQIELTYISPGIQTGTFPLQLFYVNNLEVDMSQSVLSTQVNNAATNPGDFMEGTFGGNFTDLNGATHSINGAYRVTRNW